MSYGVIFDMDGVLIDSYDAHFQSWKDLADEEGKPFTREMFTWAFGRTSRECAEKYWPEADEQKIKALDARKEVLFREIIADAFPLMQGAGELIDALHGAGFKIAIGSSGPPENVNLTLSKIDRPHCFQGVVTGMDVVRGKPEPEVFLTAAEKLGLPTHRCAVIEDAAAGVTAALRAKMTAIGYASTGRTHDQLSEAHIVVDALAELSPDRIKQLIDEHADSQGAA